MVSKERACPYILLDNFLWPPVLSQIALAKSRTSDGHSILLRGCVYICLLWCFVTTTKKNERVQLLYQRLKVFPITQPVFPICGIVCWWWTKMVYISQFYFVLHIIVTLCVPSSTLAINENDLKIVVWNQIR